MKARTTQLSILLAEELPLESEGTQRASATRICAEAIAHRLHTTLHLLHVEPLSLYPTPATRFKSILSRHLAQQKQRLSKVAAVLKVPTKAIVLDGDPARSILSQAAKRDTYELIVIGTQGRRGLERFFMGSVAESVIKNSRIPVMTLGPRAQAQPDRLLNRPKLKILVPTALTPNSLLAERYALRLAARLGGEVIFFHSIHDALHPVLQTAFTVPTRPPELSEFFEELKEEATQQLEAKIKSYKKEQVPCSFVLYDKTLSTAEAVIQESKSASASLIVMGTHGRSKVSEAFFGRTARDVILGSEIPVVTVRSKRS